MAEKGRDEKGRYTKSSDHQFTKDDAKSASHRAHKSEDHRKTEHKSADHKTSEHKTSDHRGFGKDAPKVHDTGADALARSRVAGDVHNKSVVSEALAAHRKR